VREDVIAAGRQRGREVLSCGVGDDRALDAGRLVVDRDRHARHDGALGVDDRPLNDSRGLRERGRRRKREEHDTDRHCECSDPFLRHAIDYTRAQIGIPSMNHIKSI